jgi:hypothetical protein
MSSTEPFFPTDKPRSWVIAVSSGLLGLLMGLCAFGADWFEFQFLKTIFVYGFVACWVTLAIFGLILLVGLVSGKYQEIEPRPWSEQVW